MGSSRLSAFRRVRAIYEARPETTRENPFAPAAGTKAERLLTTLS